jgi:hypothetical protein
MVTAIPLVSATTLPKKDFDVCVINGRLCCQEIFSLLSVPDRRL